MLLMIMSTGRGRETMHITNPPAKTRYRLWLPPVLVAQNRTGRSAELSATPTGINVAERAIATRTPVPCESLSVPLRHVSHSSFSEQTPSHHDTPTGKFTPRPCEPSLPHNHYPTEQMSIFISQQPTASLRRPQIPWIRYAPSPT